MLWKFLKDDFVIEALPLNDQKVEPGTEMPKRLAFDGSTNFGGINYWMRMTYITQPFTMEQEPHSHEYDQCAHLYGGDPNDFGDFQAEVWFYLGEEGEKQVITKPTIIYIPRGMMHCPLVYHRIDKPIIFLNVCFTGEYKKTMEDGKELYVHADDGI